MITIMLLTISWLAFGVLMVAVAEKAKMSVIIDGDFDRACTVVFWPIAAVIMALISLGRLGRNIGRK